MARSDAYYRLHVRSSRTRRAERLSMLRALARAVLIVGAALFVATFLWAFGVIGASLEAIW